MVRLRRKFYMPPFSSRQKAAPPREMNLYRIRYRKTDTVKPAVPVMIPDGGFLYKQAL